MVRGRGGIGVYAKLDGIVSAFVTVFKENGEIDEDGTREHIDFLIQHGLSTLTGLAMTGEFASLSYEERKMVMKFAVEEVKGRVPLIMGISDTNMQAVLELGRYAKKIGADGVFVLTPYLYSYTDSEITNFFKRVAASIKLHIMLYDSPATGRNLTPTMLKELSEVNNILSLKEGNPAQLDDVISQVGDNLAVFCSRDTYLLETLALGGAGATSIVSCVVPEAPLALYDAWKRGDLETARKIQYGLLPLVNLLIKRSYPAAIKAAMDIVGLRGGRPREPLTPLNEEERQPLQEALEKVQMLA